MRYINGGQPHCIWRRLLFFVSARTYSFLLHPQRKVPLPHALSKPLPIFSRVFERTTENAESLYRLSTEYTRIRFLCISPVMGFGRMFSSGGRKSGEISFYSLETKKATFLC